MKEQQTIQEAIWQERERILLELAEIEERSHATKTPIYQETLFRRVKEIVLQASSE